MSTHLSRILVTGASGLVGGAIAAHLVERGHQVIGLSRRPSALTGIRDIHVDLATPGWSEDLRDLRCEAIVHAGACLAKDNTDPHLCAVNAGATQELLTLAGAWEVSSFVFISGLTVIGQPLHLPITEEHPTAPLTTYHASKLFGEHMVRVLSAGRWPSASLRVTAPVGPRMPDGRILSHFVGRALRNEPLVLAGEGSRKQDFVDVRDVARCVELALSHRAEGVYNAGSGRSVSNIDLARLVIATLGSRSVIEHTGSPDPEEGIDWAISLERARSSFGYQPAISLDESIRSVARDRGWSPTPLEER